MSGRMRVEKKQGRILIEVLPPEEEVLEALRQHPGDEVPIESLVVSLSLADARGLAQKILNLLD